MSPDRFSTVTPRDQIRMSIGLRGRRRELSQKEMELYQQTNLPTLENIPMARKELFHRRDYTQGVLFATRGCPGQCDFCSIAVMYRQTLRKRPVADVAAEYGSDMGQLRCGPNFLREGTFARHRSNFHADAIR